VAGGPSTGGGERAARVELNRLLPPGPPATAAQVVEGLGLWRRPPGVARVPRVLLNMVSTVDGRAALDGLSAPLSSQADRELFHALRAPVDAVLVGASTVRRERYGRLVRDRATRRLRRERGLQDEPLAAVVSASLQLDPALPLLADAGARVVILTPATGELPASASSVEYVRAARGGALDLRAALAELHARFGVQLALCEGGPHLAAELLAAGLLDELFLSLAPMLAGGEGQAGAALRILAGMRLEPAVELQLAAVLESASQLFLHYVVVAPERVSRETIESSSLAR
jgi:riboflavin biosynthesis pyrimidine reductase